MLEVRTGGEEQRKYEQRNPDDAAHHGERQYQSGHREHARRKNHASDRVTVDVGTVVSQCHTSVGRGPAASVSRTTQTNNQSDVTSDTLTDTNPFREEFL